jgi:TIR domain/Pentapeptide repeats (8 copies)
MSSAKIRLAEVRRTSGRADLRGANLTGANLTANLSQASFDNANFSRAVVGWTFFGAIDLSKVQGLENVIHKGPSSPSSICINTIYSSRGQIPKAFLHGAGVPDTFITNLGWLVGKPGQFYSCFISYSTKDENFVQQFHADLQDNGVRCWFAPHDMRSGEKLNEQIDEAIRLHDRLLLILSPNSMESEWVKTEIFKARRREVKERKRVLFPVGMVNFEKLRDWECFDADTGRDAAREIREYFIPDFSNWKDFDSYQKNFQHLLRDLKAETGRPVRA